MGLLIRNARILTLAGDTRPRRGLALRELGVIAQGGTPARPGVAGEGEDPGVADEQSHGYRSLASRRLSSSPQGKERNLCAAGPAAGSR